MPLSTGTRLGPYEIVAPIGAGGMGEVYKAKDLRLGREVAIKVLPADKVADPERRQRFMREARAASLLNHPNIITIYDIAESEGVCFIVMEYVAGRTLGQMIQSRPLDPDRAARYAAQITAALAKAHAAGIIHRDLKPANVMLTEDDRVKVLDFGLAKLTEPLPGEEIAATLTAQTEAGAILGTAAYMSPEQVEGRGLDARSDIFAFGAVLYEMLSGQRAFYADTPVATMAAVLRQEPPALSERSGSLARVVSRCLAKDPSRRFQSMVDVMHAIEDAALASPAPKAASLAVLPFANLSADKENEYFSDGLAEEIINALTRVEGLRVIARTSSFIFRDRQQSIREIGSKLGVSAVLEGSVRRAANRIRVTVQLVNVADESPLWSERYDRDMTDVFAVQDEIAQAVVATLKVRLTGQLVKKATANVEAYDCFLKGRFHLYRLTVGEMEKARELFERAIARDPNFAFAHCELGGYYEAIAVFSVVDTRTLLPKINASLRKAIELDDTLAEAHSWLGRTLGVHEYQWAEAEREFRRAIEINPASSFAHHLYANDLLRPLRRFDEAIAEARHALELDPFSTLNHWGLAALHYMRKEYDRSISHARMALEIDPDYFLGHWTMGASLFELGNFAEAETSLATACRLAPPNGFAWAKLACTWAALNKTERVRDLVTRFESLRSSVYVSPATIGTLHFVLDDAGTGMSWLETAFEERDPILPLLFHVDPGEVYARARRHPRYQALLARMNLV